MKTNLLLEKISLPVLSFRYKYILMSMFPILLLIFYCTPLPLIYAYELGIKEQTLLTMGSWRTDDILQMRKILDAFEKEYPSIRVQFDPVPAAEYDAVLEAQLKSGTAPDIFYLRSFNISLQLFKKGYLQSLNNLKGLKENFTPQMLDPWKSVQDDLVYGVPFIATAHGIYYNKNIFKKLNLNIPKTWQELLSHAEVIKEAGIIPFANASGESWTINEIVFFNLLPNFIGGYEGRMAYLNGGRCFNDEKMISAFQALKDISPFLPPNQNLLKYIDSLHIFIQGQAAMWFGGSWDIPFIESESPEFAWDIFVPPPPEGSPQFMTFHLDAGIGLNSSSKKKEAALTLLSWLTRPESGQLMADELPGFFPMHIQKEERKLQNSHADTFQTLKKSYLTDIRFVWEKLRDKSPDGYQLINEAALNVINELWQPKEAADFVQKGLSQWFEPAAKCKNE